MTSPIGNITKRCFVDGFNGLYQETGSDYEAALRRSLSLYKLPKDGIRAPIDGLDFDYIVCQELSQLADGRLINLASSLQLPMLMVSTKPDNVLPVLQQTNFLPQCILHSNMLSMQAWSFQGANNLVLNQPLQIPTDEELNGYEKDKKYLMMTDLDLNDCPPVVMPVFQELSKRGLINLRTNTIAKWPNAAKFYINLHPFPNVKFLLASMHYDTTVVSIDSPMVREFVTNGINGFIFDSFDKLVDILQNTKQEQIDKVNGLAKKILGAKYSQKLFDTKVKSHVSNMCKKSIGAF